MKRPNNNKIKYIKENKIKSIDHASDKNNGIVTKEFDRSLVVAQLVGSSAVIFAVLSLLYR